MFRKSLALVGSLVLVGAANAQSAASHFDSNLEGWHGDT